MFNAFFSQYSKILKIYLNIFTVDCPFVFKLIVLLSLVEDGLEAQLCGGAGFDVDGVLETARNRDGIFKPLKRQ
jgi:hypothetical protein